MKVLVAGDYVPRGQVADMMDRRDFSYFDEIRSLTNSMDLSIVNLEAPIVENEAKPIEKCGPNLRTTAKVVESLRYAGFDMVTLANNHIMDYGSVGLEDTLENLNKGDILSVGAGENIEEAGRTVYFEKDGKTIAIINCCEHEFSIAGIHTQGANPLNPMRQYHAIQDAKSRADYIIVIVHGGHEHWQLPSPRMVETYRFFIEIGADAVVNHHQHVYSGYEVYNGKPIFYGLGNFCFEYSTKKNTSWNYGYVVSLEFGDKVDFKLHPYLQCNETPEVRLLEKNHFDFYLKNLNMIIGDSDRLMSSTIEYYESCKQESLAVLKPFGGRIYNALWRRGLLPSFFIKEKRLRMDNMVQCESHRDKLSYFFDSQRNKING